MFLYAAVTLRAYYFTWLLLHFSLVLSSFTILTLDCNAAIENYLLAIPTFSKYWHVFKGCLHKEFVHVRYKTVFLHKSQERDG